MDEKKCDLIAFANGDLSLDVRVDPDGGYQDAYVLGINKAVPFFAGVVIGAIRRIDTTEGKLIVAPKGIDYGDEEILKEVGFQENYFESVLLR